MDKTVSVVTNDSANATIPLTIKGRVIEIYSLSPRTVKLKGYVGETVKDTIRLVPNKAYKFKVLGITAKRGENIRFQFKEVKDGDQSGYDITVENTAKTPGVYFDTLLVKTDSEQKPQIDISVIGSIRKPTEHTTATNGG